MNHTNNYIYYIIRKERSNSFYVFKLSKIITGKMKKTNKQTPAHKIKNPQHLPDSIYR